MKLTFGPLAFEANVSRKASVMKLTLGPLAFDILLLLRLWLPAVVLIGLCTGILVSFDPVLLLIDQIAPPSQLGLFIGIAWLSLLLFYILLGVAFTYFSARLHRRSFGSEEWRVQRRMVILSGVPSYAFCLLCLFLTLIGIFSPNANSVGVYAFGIGFLVSGLFSCSYLLLIRFFLRRLRNLGARTPHLMRS